MLEETRTRRTAALTGPVEGNGGLNATMRQIFARLAPSTSSAAAAREADDPSCIGEAGPRDRNCEPDAVRRAEAHAAFRSVYGSEQAAVDAAIAVVEAEVARLRSTVLAYGEALKEIEVYGADAAARSTAAAALRQAPERLRSAPPVPHASPFAGALYG